MISKELVRMMAEESDEMALWATIIRWWYLKEADVEHACELLGTSSCGLCRRFECGSCPIGKFGGGCMRTDRSLFRVASLMLRNQNEAGWKKAADAMFDYLVDLLEPIAEKKEKAVAYKRGDHFLNGANDEYVLSALGNHQMALICIKDGMRWVDVLVVNDVGKVTQEEFSKICFAGTFTLIEDKRGYLPIGDGW